jgi:WhiB family redox-sensing transcriptional regulator
VTTHWWEQHGTCVAEHADPETFFPGGNNLEADVAAARDICKRCPVGRHCHDTGTSYDRPHGVWGGVVLEWRKVGVGDLALRRRREAAYRRQVAEMRHLWATTLPQLEPSEVRCADVINIASRRPIADDPHGRRAAAGEAWA